MTSGELRDRSQPSGEPAGSETALTLTGNDIAVAANGLGHLLNFWKKQPPSGFKRQSVETVQALMRKLDRINHHAHPYAHGMEGVPEHGAAPIMRLNAPVVRKTQRAAVKANRDAGMEP